MANAEKELFDIVNRHHACVSVVDRILQNLDCDILAQKLNAISAGRNKRAKKRGGNR